MLKANLRDAQGYVKAIENGDFIISDPITRLPIELADDWNRCFYPGQEVEMFEMHKTTKAFGAVCLNCRHIDPQGRVKGHCAACGLYYDRTGRPLRKLCGWSVEGVVKLNEDEYEVVVHKFGFRITESSTKEWQIRFLSRARSQTSEKAAAIYISQYISD